MMDKRLAWKNGVTWGNTRSDFILVEASSIPSHTDPTTKARKFSSHLLTQSSCPCVLLSPIKVRKRKAIFPQIQSPDHSHTRSHRFLTSLSMQSRRLHLAVLWLLWHHEGSVLCIIVGSVSLVTLGLHQTSPWSGLGGFLLSSLRLLENSPLRLPLAHLPISDIWRPGRA